MGKENPSPTNTGGISNEVSSLESQDSERYSRYSVDKEAGLATCRVCQCAESDKRGDAALGFLGITAPLQESRKSNGEIQPDVKQVQKDGESAKNVGRESGFVEFISPDGEIFICNADLEMGTCYSQDALIELGCSCKSDLALVHYACALKWFVNHGSTVCEICGHIAKNIRIADFKKVVVSLKDYEALRERTASGEPNPAQRWSLLKILQQNGLWKVLGSCLLLAYLLSLLHGSLLLVLERKLLEVVFIFSSEAFVL